MLNKNRNQKGNVAVIILGLLAFAALIIGWLWAYPQYNVYKQRKEGEAILAHASFSREVAVAEAKAKMESGIGIKLVAGGPGSLR